MQLRTENAAEIEYLDRYYRGDQPILYRKKVNRPEVNNKIVVNLAYELVERKTADICAEPIQYVLRGTDDKKSDEISWLNAIMDSENKQECDIDICRWRSICGTAYRFIGNDEGNGSVFDESDFELSSLKTRFIHSWCTFRIINRLFHARFEKMKMVRSFIFAIRTVSGLKFQKGN